MHVYFRFKSINLLIPALLPQVFDSKAAIIQALSFLSFD